MFNKFVFISLAFLFVAVTAKFEFDVKKCRAEVKQARERLTNVVQHLAQYEAENRLSRLLVGLGNVEVKDDDDLSEVCGERKPTMFPPPNDDDNKTSNFEIPSIFGETSENDIYVQYMSSLFQNLADEEKICNGGYDGLNSVTEEQLYGALTLFATNHAGPMCPICTGLVTMIIDEIKLNLGNLSDEMQKIILALLSYLPQPEQICLKVFPKCIDHSNGTDFNSTKCFQCSMCMSTTTILEHNFLLVEKRVQSFKDLLQTVVIDDFCTELCYAYPPSDEKKKGPFPHGVSKDDCVTNTLLAYDIILKAAKYLFLPSPFCRNLCPSNLTPNILHCLHAFCIENQREFSFLAPICDLIPDHPDDAAKYLNIVGQRRHDEF
ncbi:unnamed protein product [Bursaphelenchus okinawaensis]|uniref:Saposin B-type domain-containing protein n=1 Tax=Bursaphelenchus okinawaensis TaxID=465554 RepID=A0A811JQU5_9BILA|nr:unnamed protein product [Bursaphelenchus okinawaensis]CAG9078469.1 unnamed protein product [Bursaphelenchus okinawaensis]